MKRVTTQLAACLLIVPGVWGLSGCAAPGGPGADAGAQRQRVDDAPKAGQKAPLFALRRHDDSRKKVELAAAFAAKPVILFFGSYT